MKCTIIIPCYNGGELLKKNLPLLFSYCNKSENSFDIIIVNDGSVDNTLETLKRFKDQITLLSYSKNKGKGGAIKYGISHCKKCDAVIYMDCDFSTDINVIDSFLYQLKDCDMVVASRFTKGSVLPVKRKLKRRIASKCCNIFTNSLFHFNLKDTQCGFKCIKYDLANKFIDIQKQNGWSFEIEYLYFAKLNNYKFKEQPVVWTENYDTSVSLTRASLKFIKSLLKIKKNKKQYIENN